jgi:Spy/CpxP family protein refolding chaperone
VGAQAWQRSAFTDLYKAVREPRTYAVLPSIYSDLQAGIQQWRLSNHQSGASMNPFRIPAASFIVAIIAASFAAAAPAIADPAQPAPPHGERMAGPGFDANHGPDAGPGPGERRGPGGHGPRHGLKGPGLPFLRGIDLSEAQEDRLFAILHAEVPQLREQDKIEDKAHEALRAMAESGDYNEAKAAAHTKALGQAIAARELLRVRTAGQVMALLTPEQRAQLKQERAPRAPRAPQ